MISQSGRRNSSAWAHPGPGEEVFVRWNPTSLGVKYLLGLDITRDATRLRHMHELAGTSRPGVQKIVKIEGRATMTNNFSKLELAWRTRAGGGGRTRRDYLDFVVNGQSLHDLLRSGDNIGCLGWLPQNVERVILEQLAAERLSELGNNHYPIYVCAECGDIGCGAITVQIEKTEDGFVWKNLGYENNYDASMSNFERYEGIGPFHFKRSEYLQTLESSKDLAERSRRNQEAS